MLHSRKLQRAPFTSTVSNPQTTPAGSTSKGQEPLTVDNNSKAASTLAQQLDNAKTEIRLLQIKLATTQEEVERLNNLYKAAVAKNLQLESELKAKMEQNTALEEEVLLLSVKQTEIQCGLSPLSRTPSPFIITPIPTTTPSPGEVNDQTIATIATPSFSLGLTQEEQPNSTQNMSTALVPVFLPQQQISPALAKRTRSQIDILSPIPGSADSKVVKNYRMCAAFKNLSPGHKFMVDDLAEHNELEGYNY